MPDTLVIALCTFLYLAGGGILLMGVAALSAAARSLDHRISHSHSFTICGDSKRGDNRVSIYTHNGDKNAR